MTDAAMTHAQLCQKAAAAFLQTAVIIDNEAHLSPDENDESQAPRKAVKVEKPSTKKGATSQKKAAVAEVKADETDEAKEKKAHDLDAKALSDAFLSRSIICGIFKPEKDEEMVETMIKAATAADIVIVDWHLQGRVNGSKKAKEIISELLKSDLSQAGRLRLIAVYTGQKNLKELADELLRRLHEDRALAYFRIDDEDSGVVVGPYTRIVFFNKRDTLGPLPEDRIASEAELPGELVEQFGKLAPGILPATAMSAIAAIRKNTHHVLATFHGDLDGAYVGDRCMISHAEDADEFLQHLITDELDAVVATAGTVSRYAGNEAVKAWLGTKARLADSENKPCNVETVVEILDFVSDDPEKYENGVVDILIGAGRTKRKSKELFKEFAQLFYSVDQASYMLHEFSRLSNLRRETGTRSHFHNAWLPALSLGAILRPVFDAEGKGPAGLTADQLLFCVQPRCDSVRVSHENGRKFPFLILSPSEKKIRAIIAQNGTDVTYAMTPSLYNSVLFEFAPTGPGEPFIQAEKNEDGYFFKDRNDNTFEWVADMKDLPAQREAGQLGAGAARVGLDEHEWLRLKG